MPGGGPFTILLADDDEDDRVLAGLALREAAHKVVLHTVADGRDLMDYLHRRGRHRGVDAPRPDLILLDLNMPGMHGHEVLTRIKQDPGLRSIPVIVITTSRRTEDIASSYALGANSHMSKPIGFSDFVDAMRGLTRYWSDVVTLPPAPTTT